MLKNIVFFILTGLAMGMTGICSAVLFLPYEAALIFIVSALSGMWLMKQAVRSNVAEKLAPLTFLPLLVPVQTPGSWVLTGIFCGAVSSLPSDLTGRFGKINFLAAVSLCGAAGFFAGIPLAADVNTALYSSLLILPGAVMLLWRVLRGRRMLLTAMLFFLTAAACFSLWFQLASSWGMASFYSPGRNGLYFMTPGGGKRNWSIGARNGRSYDFPEAGLRRLPAVLPAALQVMPPDDAGLKVLWVGEVPSRIPESFLSLPWVAQVDQWDWQAGQAAEYDLIFVSELPLQHSGKSRAALLKKLYREYLRSGGVMLIPASERIRYGIGGHPAAMTAKPVALPGNPDMLMMQKSGNTITGDMAELEKRLSELTAGQSTILPPGIMSVLYQHRAGEPDAGCGTVRNIRPDWQVNGVWLAMVAGIYAVVRIIAGRHPGITPGAVAAECGLAAGMLWAFSAESLAEYTLVSGVAAGTLPVMLASALPSGKISSRKILPWLLAAALAVIVYCGVALPVLVLSAAVLLAFGTGCAFWQDKYADLPVSYLYMLGMVAGIFLMPVSGGVFLPLAILLLIIPQWIRL